MAIEDNIAEEQQKLYSKLVLVVADDCQDSSDVEGADVDIRHLTFSSSYSPEHTHMAWAGATEAGEDQWLGTGFVLFAFPLCMQISRLNICTY